MGGGGAHEGHRYGLGGGWVRPSETRGEKMKTRSKPVLERNLERRVRAMTGLRPGSSRQPIRVAKERGAFGNSLAQSKWRVERSGM